MKKRFVNTGPNEGFGTTEWLHQNLKPATGSAEGPIDTNAMKEKGHVFPDVRDGSIRKGAK